MKSKLLLSISIILLLIESSSAQLKNDTSKRVAVSLDSFVFRLMVDYVSADTFALHIAEIEKNTISHLGDNTGLSYLYLLIREFMNRTTAATTNSCPPYTIKKQHAVRHF